MSPEVTHFALLNKVPQHVLHRTGTENELLVAYLLPTGHVVAYSVPLVGGAFIWSGKVYR